MATTTGLMTVEQFEALPEPTGEFYYELHHGELVKMTRPKPRHLRLQNRLVDLFRALAGGSYFVSMELVFRPLPEHEVWAADVGVVTVLRWDQATDEHLLGSPEIVIEVLSPSNTASEINDKEMMCLDTGCLEFWVVDPKRKLVKVSTPDRRTTTYREPDRIRIKALGGAELSVSSIFEGIA